MLFVYLFTLNFIQSGHTSQSKVWETAPTSTHAHTQTRKGTLTYLHFITLSLYHLLSLLPDIQSSLGAATDVWRKRMSYRTGVHTVFVCACMCGWVFVCSEYQCAPCLTGLFHLLTYTFLFLAHSTDIKVWNIFSPGHKPLVSDLGFYLLTANSCTLLAYYWTSKMWLKPLNKLSPQDS